MNTTTFSGFLWIWEDPEWFLPLSPPPPVDVNVLLLKFFMEIKELLYYLNNILI